MKAIALGAMLVALSAGWVQAQEITVSSSWAYASTDKETAAFLTIRNHGESDRLIGASSDASSTVELHTSIHSNGHMEMHSIGSIPVPSGATVTLKPNGNHLMCLGLKGPLRQGSHFPLNLHFDKAGEILVSVEVKAPAPQK